MSPMGRLVLASALLVLVALGCGYKNPNAPASVTGKVTYKGKPVPAGTVRFHSQDAGSVTCQLDVDGSYSSTDVPAKEMTVTVETESAKPTDTPANQARKQSGSAPPPPGSEKSKPLEYVKIPEKYAKTKDTPLKTTLKPGKNTYNIELTD
jgi:hypothetical protein